MIYSSHLYVTYDNYRRYFSCRNIYSNCCVCFKKQVKKITALLATQRSSFNNNRGATVIGVPFLQLQQHNGHKMSIANFNFLGGHDGHLFVLLPRWTRCPPFNFVSDCPPCFRRLTSSQLETKLILFQHLSTSTQLVSKLPNKNPSLRPG